MYGKNRQLFFPPVRKKNKTVEVPFQSFEAQKKYHQNCLAGYLADQDSRWPIMSLQNIAKVAAILRH